jgi:hypothetical protein
VTGSIADAFLAMFTLERACEIQVVAQSGGGALIPIPKPILEGARAQSRQVTRGLGGQLAWPALLRKLDRLDPGYRGAGNAGLARAEPRRADLLVTGAKTADFAKRGRRRGSCGQNACKFKAVVGNHRCRRNSEGMRGNSEFDQRGGFRSAKGQQPAARGKARRGVAELRESVRLPVTWTPGSGREPMAICGVG